MLEEHRAGKADVEADEAVDELRPGGVAEGEAARERRPLNRSGLGHRDRGGRALDSSGAGDEGKLEALHSGDLESREATCGCGPRRGALRL